MPSPLGFLPSFSPRSIFRASVLAAIFLLPLAGEARVAFDALQRDGYGMVALDRPEPNMLTVAATINGRKARLIVDTGWAGEGITVKAEYAQALRSPVEGIRRFGHSASGQALTGFHKGVADTVTMGNVLMRQVPVYCGNIPSLQAASTRSLHADGFIGSGFLSTCSAIIDLHNLRVYLRPPGTGRRAIIGGAMKAQGFAEVPFHIIQTNCLVAVEINGVPGIMVVDTGATLAGVDERFALQMKAKSRIAHALTIDAAGIERATKLTTLSSFRIGGVNVRAPDLRIGSYGFYDATHGKIVGLLGMDILGHNGTIIDFGQRKLYFYPL